jgi:hypothetical protein
VCLYFVSRHFNVGFPAKVRSIGTVPRAYDIFRPMKEWKGENLKGTSSVPRRKTVRHVRDCYNTKEILLGKFRGNVYPVSPASLLGVPPRY